MKKKADKQQQNKSKKKVPGTPFPKGKSGNPKGRPKKEHTFSDTARELMAANSIDVSWTIVDGNGQKKTKTLQLKSTKNMHYGTAAALIVEALKGNVNALREIINRTEGKAVQKVEADLKGDIHLHFDKEDEEL